MSNLNPMNDEQLDELIQCVERIKALEAEIARLRLTDEEREAVKLAIDSMSGVEDISASWSEREMAAIATLRGLLERLS